MQRGFSLVEAIVAMAIMSTAIMAIAQLSIVSVGVNRAARSTTIATMLAVQQMERLQSAAWSELIVSPSGSLDRNTAGYCDFLDVNGRAIAPATSPPAGAAFVRRWALHLIDSGDALVLQVVVMPTTGPRGLVGGRGPEEARLVGARIRH